MLKVKPALAAFAWVFAGLLLLRAGDGQASLSVGPTEKIERGMEDRIDRPGHDYDKFHIDDLRPDRCRNECERAQGRCKAWGSYGAVGAKLQRRGSCGVNQPRISC